LAALQEETIMANALSFELNQTADWRARKSERHPEDGRNADAVIRLTTLAAQFEKNAHVFGVIDEMETDVDNPHFDQYPETRNEVLRSIGFGFAPETVDDVAVAIVRSIRAYPSVEDLVRLNNAQGKRAAAATAAGKPANCY
jgi:hypothetical protein